MNLKKLNEAIEAYSRYLLANPSHDPYWKWESQSVFQRQWDVDAIDFRSMYDSSLQNSRTRRWWRRENYSPKDMMLKFIDLNPDYTRMAFRDLFNESREIDGRVNRFVFYCDELLREFRDQFDHSRENAHYHDDNHEIISIYLALRYPADYAPYRFGPFRKFMERIGSREIPEVNDISRFFKVMRTLDKFLRKNEVIVPEHRRRIDGEKHFTGETMLMAEDFYLFVSGAADK